MRRPNHQASAAGFTLIEAMASVALTATTMLALGWVVGQWLPNWQHGFVALQGADLLSLALDRLGEDLSAAEWVTPWGDAPGPLFDGEASSVIFVRSAIGPNARQHLEVVRIAGGSDDRGRAVTRTVASFYPTARGRPGLPFKFADPVALVRAPLQVTFAYAGPDRVWAQRWKDQERLPESIKITVRDPASRTLVASTAVRVKVTAGVLSANAGAPANTDAGQTGPAGAPANSAPASTQ
jgi:general secretion pathway protein J